MTNYLYHPENGKRFPSHWALGYRQMPDCCAITLIINFPGGEYFWNPSLVEEEDRYRPYDSWFDRNKNVNLVNISKDQMKEALKRNLLDEINKIKGYDESPNRLQVYLNQNQYRSAEWGLAEVLKEVGFKSAGPAFKNPKTGNLIREYQYDLTS